MAKTRKRCETFPLRFDFSRREPNFYKTVGDCERNSHLGKMCGNCNKGTKVVVFLVGIILIVVIIVLVASICSLKDDTRNSLKTLRESESEEKVLEIPLGKLKWVTLKSRENRSYYAFYKVPFAKPPIGKLRFESPQPPDKWEGVRFFQDVAPQCLQKSKYSPIIEAVGSENCLYMNIYTPRLPKNGDDQLMPTLVYLHGGGYTDGNGSRYGGKYFMDEDCVLITFQYRLGVFGFLSSEDGVIKGNLGLKDHVQALRFVKEYIKYFSGDPSRIMIFGNSAGGMSVNQLVSSPMASGLFHTAITESGPGASQIKSREMHLKSYQALAKQIGCWSGRSEQVLECLKKQNENDLAVIRGPDIIFSATIEKYESADDDEKFLPDSFYNLFKAGRVNKVPWIQGVNRLEWTGTAATILKTPNETDGLNANWTGFAPQMFLVPYDDSHIKDALSLKAKEFYFGNKLVNNDTLINLTNLLSDRDIIHGAKTLGLWMAEFGVDVFLYCLSKKPGKSYSEKFMIGFPPTEYACHADELQYLFNYDGFPKYPKGSEYFEFSKYLIKTWVRFASTGNPGWEPINPKQKPLYWYELSDNPAPTTLLQKRMEFWDQFTPEELCYI